MTVKKRKDRPTKKVFESRCDHMLRDLESKIRNGDIRNGDFLPSEAELSDIYSLSRMSIRKVIERLGTRIPLSHQKGRGIQVGHHADFESENQKKVATLLPYGHKGSRPDHLKDYSGYDTSAVINAFERQLMEANIRNKFIYIDSPESLDIPQIIKELREEEYNLFVNICNGGPEVLTLSGSLLCVDVPTLTIMGFESVDYVSKVGIDNYKIGLIATRHLQENGHRNIAYVGSDKNDYWQLLRQRAFQEYCSTQGLEQSARNLFIMPERRGDKVSVGFEAGKEILKNPEITAVFCANDAIAQGLFEQALEQGKTIPEDLSVVACDNSDQYLDLDLTTISQEYHQIGVMAANLTIDYLNGRNQLAWPIQLWVNPILIKRGSVRDLNV